MINFREKGIPGLLLQLFYLVFFTSLVFTLRAASSISLVVIVVVSTFIHPRVWMTIFQFKTRNLFLFGCTFLFLVHLLALLYTNDLEKGWDAVRIKTGLLITPLAACLASQFSFSGWKKLFYTFCLVLVAGTLYCLLLAVINFKETGDSSVIFYHALVAPLQQHAIYFSLLIVIGLVFLLENLDRRDYFFSFTFQAGLVIYFSLFLFLLASKFVISFYIVYLVFYFITHLQRNKVKRMAVAGIIVVCVITTAMLFLTRNPVRERFYDILKGDIRIVGKEKFSQGDYFNGVQFRLLQWRFVAEILTENNQWWLGVSPGDAQDKLNEKYIAYNIYAGNPATGDRGYLAYNTHNQYLETVLQTGILGLGILLLTCISLVKMALHSQDRLAGIVTLLLLAWLLSEAALETQYGIIIFTFFPLFISTSHINRSSGHIVKPTF